MINAPVLDYRIFSRWISDFLIYNRIQPIVGDKGCLIIIFAPPNILLATAVYVLLRLCGTELLLSIEWVVGYSPPPLNRRYHSQNVLEKCSQNVTYNFKMLEIKILVFLRGRIMFL